MRPAAQRLVRAETLGILFLLFAAFTFLTRAPWVDLPCYWDECGYYLPAALDFFHGSFIPRTVPASIHPPGLSAWLAAVWRVAGYRIEATRLAMLLVAAAAAVFSMLLAVELLRAARGMPAFLAAGLVCISPVFFAQSLLAQPDLPAMLFTAMALWLFLRERIALAALACTALVLVKETGVVAPLVFGVWLVAERRRDAAWFMAPLAVLAAWLVILHSSTGHWAGNAAFADYNLRYPLHPARFAVNLLRRIYYLGFANLHWIGAFAILFAWRTSPIFRARGWRIASVFGVAHVLVVTLLGGATLERYLLPVLPILYTAMAAGLDCFPRRPRLICSAALICGLAVGIFVNPPYPFPYEDNLAWTDFVRLQSDAADTIGRRYSAARIVTLWPLTAELAQPELGYTHVPVQVDTLPDLSAATIAALDWNRVQALAAFSREWDPSWSPLHFAPIRKLWRALFGYEPFSTEDELRRAAPYPPIARWRRGGQWMELYVQPRFHNP